MKLAGMHYLQVTLKPIIDEVRAFKPFFFFLIKMSLQKALREQVLFFLLILRLFVGKIVKNPFLHTLKSFLLF